METKNKSLVSTFIQQKYKYYLWRAGGKKIKKFKQLQVLLTSNQFI